MTITYSDTTRKILIDAREILADEERFTRGKLFVNVDLEADPLCGNVMVCALGAVALAAWGPGAITMVLPNEPNRWNQSKERHISEGDIATHPLTKDAVDLLDRAAEEVTNAGCDEDCDCSCEVSIVDLNDDSDREEGYIELLSAFDLAISWTE